MEGMYQWSPGVTLEAVEKQIIVIAFRHYRGNKTATANALGISIRTLDNKFEKYEAEDKDFKERQENERRRREEFLARSRGQSSPVPSASPAQAQPQSISKATPGLDMESASKVATQPAVSMSKPKEVQTVLPASASAGYSRKGR